MKLDTLTSCVVTQAKLVVKIKRLVPGLEGDYLWSWQATASSEPLPSRLPRHSKRLPDRCPTHLALTEDAAAPVFWTAG
jgi:hypothetical protein